MQGFQRPTARRSPGCSRGRKHLRGLLVLEGDRCEPPVWPGRDMPERKPCSRRHPGSRMTPDPSVPQKKAGKHLCERTGPDQSQDESPAAVSLKPVRECSTAPTTSYHWPSVWPTRSGLPTAASPRHAYSAGSRYRQGRRQAARLQ